MLLKILLELIGISPALIGDVEAILAEIHTSDPTGTKVANIATIATAIATTAVKVVETTQPAQDASGSG